MNTNACSHDVFVVISIFSIIIFHGTEHTLHIYDDDDDDISSERCTHIKPSDRFIHTTHTYSKYFFCIIFFCISNDGHCVCNVHARAHIQTNETLTLWEIYVHVQYPLKILDVHTNALEMRDKEIIWCFFVVFVYVFFLTPFYLSLSFPGSSFICSYSFSSLHPMPSHNNAFLGFYCSQWRKSTHCMALVCHYFGCFFYWYFKQTNLKLFIFFIVVRLSHFFFVLCSHLIGYSIQFDYSENIKYE